MVKKLQKISAQKQSATAERGPLGSAIKDSAQQIWLAGLGAFSKAQEEGSKVFDTLVKEGLSIQRKTQAVAEERINEATSRMSDMANGLSSRAAGQWDKLENIFEERVAKALGKLGVPSAKDVEALIERIDTLTAQVQRAGGKAATAAAKTTKAAAKPAPQPAAKAAAKKAPPARKAAAKPAAPKAAPAKAPARKRSPKATPAAPAGDAAA